MDTTTQNAMRLHDALTHLRAALQCLDAAEQHSAAAQLDHLIHEVQATVRAASGTS
jgi:hypothetical protein